VRNERGRSERVNGSRAGATQGATQGEPDPPRLRTGTDREDRHGSRERKKQHHNNRRRRHHHRRRIKKESLGSTGPQGHDNHMYYIFLVDRVLTIPQYKHQRLLKHIYMIHTLEVYAIRHDVY